MENYKTSLTFHSLWNNRN